MRKQLKFYMVVGLLALMLPMLFGYLGPVGAENSETVADHQDSKSMSNDTCMGCHDPNQIDAGNGDNPGAHRKHALSAFLEFMPATGGSGCGICHYETVYGGGTGEGLGSGYEGDLSYADAEDSTEADALNDNYGRSANKHVKADVCENCHGQFSSGLASHDSTDVGGSTFSVTISTNCSQDGACHSGTSNGGAPSAAHVAAVNYVDQDYGDSFSFCAKCHGGNAWYQTTETVAGLEGQ